MSAVTEIASTDNPHIGRYYQPFDRRMGDVIPFYWNGEYHIFFLDYGKDRFYAVPRSARRTPWGHIASRDLVNWRRLPDAVTPSDGEAVDSGSCATGAVFEHAGRFYLYYTGRSFTRQGDKREVVCLAVSDDLVNWTKDPGNPIAVPDPAHYGIENFRDPFVFRNDETGEFCMLVTANHPEGFINRRGCLALLTSRDLKTWEHRGPFWAPGMNFHHECPDVFRMGAWWYLFYSTDGRTHYRMSRSPQGPWQCPEIDTFDDRWFYAAKTAGDDNRRILFAWLATKVPATDDGDYEWGGNLSCRELVQADDGTLHTALPPEHRATVRRSGPFAVRPISGTVSGTAPGPITVAKPDGFAGATLGPVGADVQVRLTIRPEPGTRAFGLVLRSDAEASSGYSVRFDTARRQVSIATFDRPGAPRNVVSHHWTPPEQVEVTATCAGSVIDVVASGGGAVIGRFHDHKGAELGLWVEEGGAEFSDIGVFEPNV